MEECQSGWLERSWKPSYVRAYLGFESLFLLIKSDRLSVLSDFILDGYWVARTLQDKVLSGFEREWAEAEEFLPSDEITKAKLGIAVQRERARHPYSSSILKESRLGLLFCIDVVLYFNVTFESEENKHNVMLNLFQHLTNLACLLHSGKTLK